MPYFSNKEIARLLRSISAVYSAKGTDRFKVIAYDNAADSIEHATSDIKDLWDDGKLDTVPGLGKSIQGHLDELFKTGKVKHFEDIKKDMPSGMFELLGIGGLGPKSAYKLASTLKLKSIKDLADAAKAQKIRKIPGFGERSEQEILTAIGEYKGEGKRLVLPLAFSQAEVVLEHLRQNKDCKRAEPLGSLRRMVATVGDIDIAVASENPTNIIEHFKKYRQVSRVLDAGLRKSSVLLKNGMQVDLLVASTKAYGALLQHFTGSKNHNIRLREHALKKGMSVSDYGIKVKGRIHEFATEESFYKFLGMDYIEPEMREDAGEVEAAISHTLPKVVGTKDIKGDIHIHTSYPIEPSHDLGKHTPEAMIKRAIELGYEYIGLSDHSPGVSTHSKSQIIELIRKRTHKIEQLRDSFKSIRILNLLEIDILNNAELSVPEEGLKLLDGAIAGIHSSHSQDKATITKRLMVAINSPNVKVISHPTGRLLDGRESYSADWPEVYKACKKTETMLEINAWPNRLDLPDVMVRDAVKEGIKLVINSDSHALPHMDNMRFGVSVARRGWATEKDVVNTQPWLQFKKTFKI